MSSKLRWLVDLGVQVARRPASAATLVPYMRRPFQSTWDAGEPWWNWAAVRYLEGVLPAHGVAFEYGSGSSTAWLVAHGFQVTAIESDAFWTEKVAERCPTADIRFIPGVDSGTVRSEPQLFDHGRHFFDDYVASIDAVAPASLDLVVIDGDCRAQCARHAVSKVKPNGIVVLDDTHWDFLKPAEAPFTGWETTRHSGFKRRCASVFETSFFRCPA